MGCFRGYIEIYDSDSFMSRFVWDNDMKSLSTKEKPQDRGDDEGKKRYDS